jgi:tetratricopeptide (TPR) repeat protein
VLNAAVVHPASRTLWHATSMQPHAPFGAYEAFSPVEGATLPPPLAADPWLASAVGRAEAEAVAAARRGLEDFEAGRFDAAAREWDRLAAGTPPVLDPVRLAWGRALARWHSGDLDGAYAVLAPVETGTDRVNASAHGLVARARLADLLGRREEALRLYGAARKLLDAHAEYTVFDPLRERIEAGLAAPSDDRNPPPLGFVLQVPQ